MYDLCFRSPVNVELVGMQNCKFSHERANSLVFSRNFPNIESIG